MKIISPVNLIYQRAKSECHREPIGPLSLNFPRIGQPYNTHPIMPIYMFAHLSSRLACQNRTPVQLMCVYLIEHLLAACCRHRLSCTYWRCMTATAKYLLAVHEANCCSSLDVLARI